jgi:transposase
MPNYAGIDWGDQAHRVCIVNDTGNPVTNREVKHTREGLEQLVRLLAKHQVALVAIERPTGLLVDTLIDARFHVVSIHPNAVKASRPRYRSAFSESDRGDAYLLADLIRTDQHRFTILEPRSDEMRAIRRLARARDELVKQKVMLTNQLTSTLQSSWPGALELFGKLDSPIALAFLERYPSPHDTRGLGIKRMEGFLAKNHYPGRQKPEDLLGKLKSAPQSLEGPLEAEASREVVLSFVQNLKVLLGRLKNVTSALQHANDKTAMGQLIKSFPATGETNAAQIVAELGDDPNRFTSRDHLASEAGVTPVTRASGKRHAVAFRYACNKNLRKAFTTWANNSRQQSPWAQEIYQKAKDRGCRHPHAIRILTRAWSRVLYACWKNGTPYDPTAHGAAN